MTNFDDIIEFAISREKEAVRFYSDLQDKAQFAPQKRVLREFEAMETGHVTLLEGVKKREGFKAKALPPVDLKLDDYLVAVEPAAQLSYQDILILAIKKEKRSMDLYSRMAAEAGDTEIETVFQRLFTEESNHKSYFERIYDEEILSEN